ncbi:MAG: sulfotransferase family protein, partial [Acidimicrobiales bacterium]
WWQSASQTIFSLDASQLPPEMSEWFEMWKVVAASRFTENWKDEEAARAAYERHNAEVRSSAPRDRLVEWQPKDGWGPLCRALGVEVPDRPFPHLNTREDFPRPADVTDLSGVIDQLAQGRPES